MNRKVLTTLIVAFVIASLCGFVTYRLVTSHMAATAPLKTARVVAAASDIKLGTVLSSSDLKMVEIAGSPPKGAIFNAEAAVGRGVISNLYEGEPVLESRLAAPGSGGGLAATIPPGMRACAVKVDDVVGVAGFVTPGMRVDVLASGTPPGASATTQGTVTSTILQNIEVLSAGTDIQKDAEGKPHQVQVVNLLVTPEEAQSLSLASNQLKIQLVLRNPLDTKVSQVAGTAMSNLFVGQNSAPKPFRRVVPVVRKKAELEPFKVQVINGSTVSEEKFSSVGGHQ